MHINRQFTKCKYFNKVGCNNYSWNKAFLFCSVILISSISSSGEIIMPLNFKFSNVFQLYSPILMIQSQGGVVIFSFTLSSYALCLVDIMYKQIALKYIYFGRRQDFLIDFFYFLVCYLKPGKLILKLRKMLAKQTETNTCGSILLLHLSTVVLK